MTNYAAGRRAEWRARDYLEARGYYVIRSAGSKGLIDLVAFKRSRPILVIQVKYGKRTHHGAAPSWADDNWRKLVDMDANGELPRNVRVAAFVYQRGTAKPSIILVDHAAPMAQAAEVDL